MLSRLRRGWTPTERARFFAEVQSFDAPAFLQSPFSRSIVEAPLLFGSPVVRDWQGSHDSSDSSFRVNLEGEFAAGESYWDLVAGAASWVLEIRAAPGDERVRVAIAPTRKTRAENPVAEGLEKLVSHPDPERGPFFDARILVREGRFAGNREQRTWASRSSGVRVYLEGFRVLPYGEPKDDWLAIDADYTRRPRQLEMLQSLDLDMEGGDADAGLIRLPNNNYFGGVFLVQDRCPTLRTLVNREGFVPEAGFDTLVTLVRTGIDLCTRARAAAARERRETRKRARRLDPVPAGGTREPPEQGVRVRAPGFTGATGASGGAHEDRASTLDRGRGRRCERFRHCSPEDGGRGGRACRGPDFGTLPAARPCVRRNPNGRLRARDQRVAGICADRGEVGRAVAWRCGACAWRAADSGTDPGARYGSRARIGAAGVVPDGHRESRCTSPPFAPTFP